MINSGDAVQLVFILRMRRVNGFLVKCVILQYREIDVSHEVVKF